MKTLSTLVDCYGVMITKTEEMAFMKWLNNKGIAMNTKSKAERKQIVLDWIVLSQDTFLYL